MAGQVCGEKGRNFSEREGPPLNSFRISPYPKVLQDKDLEARMTGLEPATSGVTGRCSNQLSYIPKSERVTTRVNPLDVGSQDLSERTAEKIGFAPCRTTHEKRL
jgi:hypothetical protein